MLGSDYDGQVCSAARALEVVGQRWTLLIVRDLTLGIVRFDDLVASVGVTRSILTKRLGHLEEHEIVARELYQQHPPRYEYRLTPKGEGLLPVLAGLLDWGHRHYPDPAGPTRLLEHAGCGGPVHDRTVCDRCGEQVAPHAVIPVPGPALQAQHSHVTA